MNQIINTWQKNRDEEKEQQNGRGGSHGGVAPKECLFLSLQHKWNL
jgi:hypothetical protein